MVKPPGYIIPIQFEATYFLQYLFEKKFIDFLANLKFFFISEKKDIKKRKRRHMGHNVLLFSIKKNWTLRPQACHVDVHTGSGSGPFDTDPNQTKTPGSSTMDYSSFFKKA